MFYLGVSANILTYFLVSAFFVVCLYTQDKVCVSEFLSNYRSEETAEFTASKTIFLAEHDIFYYVEENKESFSQNFSLYDISEFFIPPPPSYHNLCYIVKGLRAPPVFYFSLS